MAEYYEYILECRVNNDHEEAWVHFNFLSDQQKLDFIDYVETSYFYEALDSDETSEFLNIRQYFNI